MLSATTETEARAQLSALAHDCGDTSFAPKLVRSHDEQGLWLIYRGECPRCGREREVRFLAGLVVRPTASRLSAPRSAPLPPVKPPPRDDFDALGGGREERDLYGAPAKAACDACEGKGEYFGVTGDYATGMVTCGHCGGTGRAR